MPNEEFTRRLNRIMKLRGISAAELARETGLSKPRISQYVNGLCEAKRSGIYLLAKALNVSETWLMGCKDVPMERKTGGNSEQEKILHEKIENRYGKTIIELLAICDALNEAGQNKLLEHAKMLGKISEYTAAKTGQKI